MTDAVKEAKALKQLTVIDDMDSRRIFDDAASATAYIQKCQTEYVDFNGYPIAAAGLTEEGDFDPAVYNDDMRIAVAVLTQRGKTEQNPSDASRVHCIVIYPTPKLHAILGLPADVELPKGAALDWLTAIVEKELNHVAVRNLRKTTDAAGIAEAVGTMPTTIADYVTSGRETASGIVETYNKLWQLIKKAIGTKSKAFALRNLSKSDLLKSIQSASYAATVHPQLENRVNKKGEPESLFVMAAMFGQMLAKMESLDPAIFDKALENRNERTFNTGEDESEEFDFAAMAAKLATESAAAEPAAAAVEPDGEEVEGGESGEEPEAEQEG